jgi:hypothetical protein
MILGKYASLFLLLILCISTLQARAQSQPPANSAPVAAWTDPATGLTWITSDNGGNVTWSEASAYCSNLRLGGNTDWRLPTIDELQGIYDASAKVGDYHVKGNLKLSTGYQWSSTQKNAVEARIFDFMVGRPSYKVVGLRTFNRALCVRHSAE